MGDVLVERETSADPEHEVSIEEPTLSAVEAEAKRILQGNGITKDQLVGLWDLIPKAKCMKDRRGALMAAFGMSSRSRKHPFKMTRTLPNVTEVLNLSCTEALRVDSSKDTTGTSERGALHIHESLHLELRELGFCVPHPQAILSAAQDHLHESEQMTTQHQLTLREAFRSSPSQLWRRRQAPSAPATSEVELVLSSDEEREGPVVDVPYKRRCLAVLCSDSLEENGQHAAEIASDGENEP
ncbi:unnamed protein product [Symbiodinium natans]|uniref:Uncharacterized protein n=1 Tax=Symbiodinium natans TaxID=878477 RepID=A0A812N0X1_9DINO|nr:unnamed protein product [Symbiodinium natans]